MGATDDRAPEDRTPQTPSRFKPLIHGDPAERARAARPCARGQGGAHDHADVLWIGDAIEREYPGAMSGHALP